MTDLPPRPPPRTDGRRAPDGRYSQASMWLVILVLAAVVVAAIVFSMNRRDSVIDAGTEPVATDPVTSDSEPMDPAVTDPVAPGSGTVPADPTTGTVDPAAPAPDVVDPATPAPGTGGTTQP